MCYYWQYGWWIKNLSSHSTWDSWEFLQIRLHYSHMNPGMTIILVWSETQNLELRFVVDWPCPITVSIFFHWQVHVGLFNMWRDSQASKYHRRPRAQSVNISTAHYWTDCVLVVTLPARLHATRLQCRVPCAIHRLCECISSTQRVPA